MSLLDLLVRTCTIERLTTVVSAMGEQSRAPVVIASGVPCAIQARSGNTVRRDPGDLVDATYNIYFQISADIQDRDRIIDDQGVLYEALFVEVVHDFHHKEVTASKPDLRV